MSSRIIWSLLIATFQNFSLSSPAFINISTCCLSGKETPPKRSTVMMDCDWALKPFISKSHLSLPSLINVGMYDSLHYKKVFESVRLKYFSPELYLTFALWLLIFIFLILFDVINSHIRSKRVSGADILFILLILKDYIQSWREVKMNKIHY